MTTSRVRRSTIAVSTLTAGLFALTACSTSSGSGASSPASSASSGSGGGAPSAAGVSTTSGPAVKAKTLTMWARADDEGFLPGLISEFNAAHQDIQLKLTLIPDAQVVQKYSTAASSGSGPDLAAVEIGTIPQFTSTGWLQDITADVAALPYKSTLSPAHLTQGAVGDKNYAVPLTADVSVLYWNKTLFKKAGLNPDTAPATWADITKDAQAVRKLGGDTYGYFFSGGCGGCMGFTLLPYVWANGGEVLSNSSGKVSPTLSPNPALQSTLDFYRTLVKDDLVPSTAKTENGSNQFGQFFSGKIGMFVQGTYPYGQLKKSYPNVDFGITPVPSTDGSKSGSFAGGDDLGITKKADHALGVEVLKWFTDQAQQSLAKQGVLPIRSDIAAQYYVSQDPRNAVFVKALQVGHTPKAQKVAAVFFDNNGPFEGLIQSGIFGSGTIADAQAKAQTAAASVLTN
jgi:multiple sugar transport system substrate-binding protein